MTKNMRSKGMKLVLAAALSLGTLAASAQKTNKDKSGNGSDPFGKGDKVLGVFVGFGLDYNYYGNSVQLPAFGVTYDQGIIDNAGPGNIGVGGVLAFKTAHYNYPSGYKATWTNYIIGIRGTYHLTLLKDKVPMLDPYGGVTVGVRITNYTDTYYDRPGYTNPYSYHSSYPIAGLFVGANYKFTESFGAFAEIGYDISLLRAGVNLHF